MDQKEKLELMQTQINMCISSIGHPRREYTVNILDSAMKFQFAMEVFEQVKGGNV